MSEPHVKEPMEPKKPQAKRYFGILACYYRVGHYGLRLHTSIVLRLKPTQEHFIFSVWK